MTTPPSKVMDSMTPRELLVLFTRMGVIATHVNRSGRKLAPAKGERRIRRDARKRRRVTHARTLQRNSWRSFHEAVKTGRAKYEATKEAR